MQVYDHNLILDYVNECHGSSRVLLTGNDVPRLRHHFKAISHFIHAVSVGQQDQFLLLKASDKINTHTLMSEEDVLCSITLQIIVICEEEALLSLGACEGQTVIKDCSRLF